MRKTVCGWCGEEKPDMRNKGGGGSFIIICTHEQLKFSCLEVVESITRVPYHPL